MRVLITGAAGFIGSHFARYFAEKYPDWELFTVERFNYASSLNRLVDLKDRIKVLYHDLRAPFTDYLLSNLEDLDFVFHVAAETHVDKSMVNPLPFVESNILGTYNLLEHCRSEQPRLRMFFYISTDEVYGPAPFGTDHTEEYPHRPSNPYAATKAAAEDLCYAWEHSMGVPVIITNTMNNFGETQHAEKFVPKIIRGILQQRVITVHGTPDNVGTRKYLYARDHADAVDWLLQKGTQGQRYNVVGQQEVSNLDMVRRIERILGKTAKVQFVDFHSVRPGHDLRYSLDGAKIANLGWTPPTSFEVGIEKVVHWTIEHTEWL